MLWQCRATLRATHCSASTPIVHVVCATANARRRTQELLASICHRVAGAAAGSAVAGAKAGDLAALRPQRAVREAGAIRLTGKGRRQGRAWALRDWRQHLQTGPFGLEPSLTSMCRSEESGLAMELGV